ncbi:MAG: hypothetical protein ACE5OP_04065 [Candidatus Glassbacteria bacterium]
MKKKLMSILSVTFFFTFFFSLTAFAWHFEDVGLEADCEGFSITGEIWIAAPGYHVFTFSYSFSLNDVEIVSDTVEVEFDLGDWGGYPFEISDFWEEELCGVLTGNLDWVRLSDGYIYDTVTFEPLGFDCDCGEGCTPGYWKNHLNSWEATGFDPADDFDSVFGVDLFEPDINLEQAVWARGGKENRLARHGTAALLSAAHPDVSYPLSVSEVIALVQDEDTDTLEEANELGCPLN